METQNNFSIRDSPPPPPPPPSPSKPVKKSWLCYW